MNRKSLLRSTRIMSPLLILTLVAMFSIPTTVFGASADKETLVKAKVSKITANMKAKTLKVGSKVTLKAKVTMNPVKAKKAKVTWKSSNKKVATVNKKGVVKALKKGKATITAKAGSKKVKVKINVGGTPIKSISVSPKTKKINVDQEFKIKVKFNPKKPTNKKVYWSSNDEDVAEVSSKGVVTGVDEGTATITATTADGAKKAKCKVTVTMTDGQILQDIEDWIAEEDFELDNADINTMNEATAKADIAAELYDWINEVITDYAKDPEGNARGAATKASDIKFSAGFKQAVDEIYEDEHADDLVVIPGTNGKSDFNLKLTLNNASKTTGVQPMKINHTKVKDMAMYDLFFHLKELGASVVIDTYKGEDPFLDPDFDYVLINASFPIPDDKTVVIPEDEVLGVAAGSTLTIGNGTTTGTLNNKGFLWIKTTGNTGGIAPMTLTPCYIESKDAVVIPEGRASWTFALVNAKNIEIWGENINMNANPTISAGMTLTILGSLESRNMTIDSGATVLNYGDLSFDGRSLTVQPGGKIVNDGGLYFTSESPNISVLGTHVKGPDGELYAATVPIIEWGWSAGYNEVFVAEDEFVVPIGGFTVPTGKILTICAGDDDEEIEPGWLSLDGVLTVAGTVNVNGGFGIYEPNCIPNSSSLAKIIFDEDAEYSVGASDALKWMLEDLEVEDVTIDADMDVTNDIFIDDGQNVLFTAESEEDNVEIDIKDGFEIEVCGTFSAIGVRASGTNYTATVTGEGDFLIGSTGVVRCLYPSTRDTACGVIDITGDFYGEVGASFYAQAIGCCPMTIFYATYGADPTAVEANATYKWDIVDEEEDDPYDDIFGWLKL